MNGNQPDEGLVVVRGAADGFRPTRTVIVLPSMRERRRIAHKRRQDDDEGTDSPPGIGQA
jgi:hypothetical protein